MKIILKAEQFEIFQSPLLLGKCLLLYVLMMTTGVQLT